MPENPLTWAQKPRLLSRRVWLTPLVACAVLLAVFNLNLLVFHILAELFTVFLSFVIFFLIWGTQRFRRSHYLLFVTAGYFWVATFDIFHVLLYPGMNMFEHFGITGNRSMQLWVMARFLEATVLLSAAFIHKVRFARFKLMAILAAFTCVFHGLIFLGWFPKAFMIGEGLSPFKIAAEYGIIAILTAAMVATYLRRSHFSSAIWIWMLGAIATTAASEYIFTLYDAPEDLSTYFGHAVKIISVWLLFIGVWEVAIETPYLRSQLLSAAVEQSPSVVVITDKDANIEYVNKAFKTITGYERRAALGKNPRFLASGNTPPEAYRQMWLTLTAGRVWRGFFENRRKNGTAYTEQATISSITDESGEISHYVATKEDVTDRIRAETYLMDDESTLNKTLLGAITAVSELLEARDPYTAGHSKRVSDLAVTIARELEVPEPRVEGLRIAALLHDIGKIKIPMEILNKPGHLSDEEMALVKHHSEVGYQAIRHIPFPMNIPDIIRAHHEKWDGTGYPQGLAGDEIPFEAQILAIADVIESITSHRPYRAAMGMEAAIETAIRGRGTHFNPLVVDAVLRVRAKGLI